MAMPQRQKTWADIASAKPKNNNGKAKPTAVVSVDNALHFPFFVDDKTMKALPQFKTLFLMRGLSGSGKSTIVNAIEDKFKKDTVVCSADHYFLRRNGTYDFNKDNLGAAHEACQDRVTRACQANKRIIVVDNTNIRRWEMKFYFDLALHHSYIVVPVLPKTSWRFNPEVLAKLNKHGVPIEILEQKVQIFEELYPVYYGWFLSEESSEQLAVKARQYFLICQDSIPEFRESIYKDKELPLRGRFSLEEYYTMLNAGEPLHCTAFYSNRGKSDNSAEYSSRKAVKRSFGKIFTLKVVGFIVTPTNIGARVLLNSSQRQLWGKDDSEGIKDIPQNTNDATSASSEKHIPAEGSKQGSYEAEGAACSDLLSEMSGLNLQDKLTSSLKCEKHPETDCVTSRFRPTCGLGSRAHVTLGFTEDSTAVQTGLDQIAVNHLEETLERSPQFRPRPINTDTAAICHYSNGACVVYLNEPIQIYAMFSGRY